jgi:Spy/CpxP family protein refolding chaperone
MRVMSRLSIAAMALAMPLFVVAQAPAPRAGEQGPDPGMQGRIGPGMRGQMGPGMRQGMGPRMGMRGQMRRGRTDQFMRRNPGMAMNRLMQDPAMRERLKITPEQVTRFQTQQSAISKSMIRSHADIQVKRMELAELMRAEKPDRALIDRKLREVQDATFAAEKARIDNQLAMHELFTAEQRQEMEKMRSEFRGRMMQRGPGGPEGDRMGPRGPRRMGPPQQRPPQPPQPPADNGR